MWLLLTEIELSDVQPSSIELNREPMIDRLAPRDGYSLQYCHSSFNSTLIAMPPAIDIDSNVIFIYIETLFTDNSYTGCLDKQFNIIFTRNIRFFHWNDFYGPFPGRKKKQINTAKIPKKKKYLNESSTSLTSTKRRSTYIICPLHFPYRVPSNFPITTGFVDGWFS